MNRYFFPEPVDVDEGTLESDVAGLVATGHPDVHPDNGAPCQRFDVTGWPNLQGATLTWKKRGFLVDRHHGVLDTVTPGGGGFQVDVYPLQKAGGVRPFRLDGQFCRYADDGTELLINESTAFRLFARYRAGEAKADAFAQNCVDHRINMVRVSGMQDTGLYLPDPELQYRIFPDDETYYRDLDAFLDWTGSYGLYVDFVCCMQTQTLMPDRNAQVRHVQRVFEVLHARSSFVSKVNEQGVHDNSVSDDVLQISKPTGAAFLLSTGSKESGDETPLQPLGDLIEYHDNDAFEWWRKGGHNSMEMANHNGRAGYPSEETRTDKDPSLIHFEDAGKSEAAMCLACMIHSPEGKNADPFGFSLAHLDAHNRGVFDGGVNHRRGPYARYDNPAVLRDYSMGAYRWQVRF